MGCVASKVPVTPAVDSSGVSGSLDTSRDLLPAAASLWNQPQVDNDEFGEQSESEKSGNVESAGNSSENFQLRNMNRCTEGEQVAAGWPSWLSSVAREAIQGWVPFKADSFEKLEKHRQVKPISQGDAYSGPLIVSACTGFACTKKPKDDHPHIKPQAKSRSRQDKLGKLDPSNNSQMKSAFKLNGEENGYLGYAPHSNLKGHKPNESTKDAMLKQWLHPELQDSMYSFAGYHPRDAVVLSKNQGLVLMQLLRNFFTFFYTDSLASHLPFGLKIFRDIEIEQKRWTSRGPYCSNQKRLMNFWRSTNSMSAKL
ncbi:hypothetical protein B296_00047556 [Ensete ventricosum]|uniref:Uncharacterized protein n=1 Tax=Ensete ventricosum TaxID=4639 RepID=A0A426YYX1_ENSVE|nr:hypothetical protein B296_00047556 [Ensete ventricosum]